MSSPARPVIWRLQMYCPLETSTSMSFSSTVTTAKIQPAIDFEGGITLSTSATSLDVKLELFLRANKISAPTFMSTKHFKKSKNRKLRITRIHFSKVLCYRQFSELPNEKLKCHAALLRLP